MRLKTYILLAVWFVLVALVVVGLSAPLHYWTPSLRELMPKGVSLLQASGRWWSGRVSLSVSHLKTPVQLSWSAGGLFSPMSWQLNHPKIIGFGRARLTFSGISLWVEGLRAPIDVLPLLLPQEGLSLSGSSLHATHWHSFYNWFDNKLTAFSGQATWSEGRIRYFDAEQEKDVLVTQWRLQGQMVDHAPTIILTNEQGEALLEAQLLPRAELEITVMPAFIEALGQRWPGKSEYPAFVMIQPL